MEKKLKTWIKHTEQRIDLLRHPDRYFESVNLKELTLEEMGRLANETKNAIPERLIKGLSYPTFLNLVLTV